MTKQNSDQTNFLKHTDVEFPVRINRYLYLTGTTSRRQADRFIETGQVLVNGKAAVLGQKVEKDDKVEISKKVKQFKQNYVYFLFNKPTGVVSHNPQLGEESAESAMKFKKSKLFPVGRLDKASHGLMLMTNDGRIIDRMLNPKFDHEKEYVVRVDKPISNHFLKHMNAGVKIEDYQTKPTKTRQTGEYLFRIILTEGKKHQIRRMCAALGYQVVDLKRVRIMNLKLKNLAVGRERELTETEKNELFKSIGI